MHHRFAFTLIELLVVIAIIAILAVVVVLVLNPAQLLAQSRDANRISDLSTLKSALSIYQTDQGTGGMGTSSIMYVSVPDASSTCGDLGLPSAGPDVWGCSNISAYRSTNGTGWIPVNFAAISSGAPFGSLPVDPVNQTSSGLYYTYETSGAAYELTAALESSKYASTAQNDGGQYADLYEQGTSLALVPVDFYMESQPIQLRGSAIGATSGTSITLNLPSASQVGDLAIIFAHANQSSISISPSGWTQLNQAGGAYIAGWTFSKTLTSSDISTGSVTITFNSNNGPAAALAVFAGSTGGIRETDVLEYDGTFSSPIVGPSASAAVAGTDAALLFGGTNTTSTDTINYGVTQQTTNTNSEVLTFQTVSGAGSFTPTFSYSNPGTGYYQSIVIVKHN